MKTPKTIDEILREFYFHATGVNDYGCKECLRIKQDLASALIEGIELKNPYPESVFVPPTTKQYAELHKALLKVGLTLDKFSGDIGRMVWKNCISDCQEAIREMMR